jgi:NADH-quinone oxidoreductase subunit H
MMWVRWTLPRLRIDQVMKTCLKYCTPIAAVMFLGAVIWKYELPGGLWLAPNPPLAETREGWLEGKGPEVGIRTSEVKSSVGLSPRESVASAWAKAHATSEADIKEAR